MSRDNFYIGWANQMSTNTKRGISKLLAPFFICIPLLAIAIVAFVSPFNTHVFELGKVKEFSGILYLQPVPILMLDEGQSPIANNRAALLVGYGKNGAITFLGDVIPKVKDGEGVRVRINGTLIYGDGQVLIELTKKEKSILEVNDIETSANQVSSNSKHVTFSGEIVDPKCWFGVMKPGEGKVHKSCAIRCISGGIPPVLRVGDESDYEYYILQGDQGQMINDEILPFIAEKVKVSGKVRQVNGWNVLETDVDQILTSTM